VEKTFDELTDSVCEKNGRRFWAEIRVIYLGVAWSVKTAFLHDKQHHVVLAHDVFSAAICFPRLKKLREVFANTWLLTDEKVERPTMPPTFYPNDRIDTGTMCQILGSIGQLGSPDLGWPSSNMGILERRDIVIVLGPTHGEKGSFTRVLSHLGVGCVISDVLGPAPSSLYLDL
jgi:hypothetical protein